MCGGGSGGCFCETSISLSFFFPLGIIGNNLISDDKKCSGI